MLWLNDLRSVFAAIVLVTCLSFVSAFHSFPRNFAQINNAFLSHSRASIPSSNFMINAKSSEKLLGSTNEQLLHIPHKREFPSLLIPAMATKLIHFVTPKTAHAAGKGITFRGWDIYGRVPYDDFLFSNDKLLDPNFLRKSFVEAVTMELPIAYSTFRRKKFIGEIATVISRAAIGITGLSILGLLFFFFRHQRARFREREIELMGYSSPTSARYKNRDYSGRKIDSVQGYVDMSRGFNVEENEEAETLSRMRKANESQGDDDKKQRKPRKNKGQQRKQEKDSKEEDEDVDDADDDDEISDED